MKHKTRNDVSLNVPLTMKEKDNVNDLARPL